MMFGRRSPPPAPPPATLGESLEASEELLFQFFDFFDRTSDDAYARLVREAGSPQAAQGMLISVYFSLLMRRRFFFWKRGVEESALTELMDREMDILRKRRDGAIDNVPRNLRTPPLSREQKRQIRMILLERYRKVRMRAAQFVVPFTAASTILGGFLLYSAILLPPLSAEGTIRRLAAAEVLLLSQEQSFGDDLSAAENALRNIGAHYAERDLARIALALAPPALDKQLTLEAEVQTILWRLGTRPFFLSALAPSVFAEADMRYPPQ